MPDLLAGTTVLAQDTPPTVETNQATDETNLTSTSYAAGAAECGVTFVASTTGRADVDVYALVVGDGTNVILVSFEVREDDASGSVVHAANDFIAVRWQGTGTVSGSLSKLVESLTPGGTYFARTMHRVTGGTTMDVTHRRIKVGPAT